jgi:DNA-binding response OmpR family regulator
LTSAEFGLLHALVEGRGEPLSREQLTERVFDRPYRPGDRAIDGLVVRLRRKVEPDPDHPSVIKSARQQGYLFAGFSSARS